MPEDEELETTVSEISNISETNSNCEGLLTQIEIDLQELRDSVGTIEEFVVITKEDKKENEQKTEEVDKKEEIKGETGDQEEVEDVTLTDVYEEVSQINDNIQTNNNLMVVNVFSSGILCGVILFTLFWNRVFK